MNECAFSFCSIVEKMFADAQRVRRILDHEIDQRGRTAEIAACITLAHVVEPAQFQSLAGARGQVFQHLLDGFQHLFFAEDFFRRRVSGHVEFFHFDIELPVTRFHRVTPEIVDRQIAHDLAAVAERLVDARRDVAARHLEIGFLHDLVSQLGAAHDIQRDISELPVVGNEHFLQKLPVSRYFHDLPNSNENNSHYIEETFNSQ